MESWRGAGWAHRATHERFFPKLLKSILKFMMATVFKDEYDMKRKLEIWRLEERIMTKGMGCDGMTGSG